MLLQCTKKLLDKLGIESLSVNNDTKDINSWHANLVNLNGEEGVVFVNDETKYSVVLLNLTTFDLRDIEELFFEGLKNLLRQECIDESLIEKFIQGSSEICYSKTKDRSHISTMNEVVRFIDGMYSPRIEDNIFQIPLSMKINRLTFKKGEKYIQPNLELYKYFKEVHGDNIYDNDAYRLKITLESNGSIISRVIDVQSKDYFYNIHNVIMESFGWEDDHLHEFYINGVKNPDIIVSNDRVIFREVYDDKVKNELKAKIADFLKPGDTIEYLYDFGDDWIHKIDIIDIIKGYNKNYPTCIMAEGWITDEVDIKLINSNLKYYYW
jgi:hypothetical protein